jgi:AcrR family transcriptional regulator
VRRSREAGTEPPPAERIRDAALGLLRAGGPAALTTRAVCEHAGVTAPTLYHHYGDKDGLLRALARAELLAFFARKQRMKPSDDALQDVKRGWDDWVQFAIDQPHLVGALQSGGSATVAPLREAAEAIAAERLARLAVLKPLAVDPATGARVLVAGANAVVQLLLDGLTVAEVRSLSALLRDGLVSSLCLPEPKSPRRGQHPAKQEAAEERHSGRKVRVHR